MVIANFRSKLQNRVEIVAPADGMARIEIRDAGAFPLWVIPYFVANGEVIHLGYREHGVVEDAIVEGVAGNVGADAAAAAEGLRIADAAGAPV